MITVATTRLRRGRMRGSLAIRKVEKEDYQPSGFNRPSLSGISSSPPGRERERDAVTDGRKRKA